MKYSYNPVPKSNCSEISANLLDNNRVSSPNVSESITICFYNARSLVNKLSQFHLLYELRYNMCDRNLALGLHINLIKKSYPLTTLHIAMTVSHITWRWSIGCSQTQHLCYCNIQARPVRSDLSMSPFAHPTLCMLCIYSTQSRQHSYLIVGVLPIWSCSHTLQWH